MRFLIILLLFMSSNVLAFDGIIRCNAGNKISSTKYTNLEPINMNSNLYRAINEEGDEFIFSVNNCVIIKHHHLQ